MGKRVAKEITAKANGIAEGGGTGKELAVLPLAKQSEGQTQTTCASWFLFFGFVCRIFLCVRSLSDSDRELLFWLLMFRYLL